MTPVRVPFRFCVGGQTIFSVSRILVRVRYDLDQVIANTTPNLPVLPAHADGYELYSLPTRAVAEIREGQRDKIALIRQSYARRFICFDGAFDHYMSRFSGKTRSTLKRKRRRWAAESGGVVDIREYRHVDELALFYDLARPLSARTYQERFLSAGLPDNDAALADMKARAAADAVRAYILFMNGQPASYLYLPIDDGRLIYAYLGYDPALAHLSPGTVLQLEALVRLFAEARYRVFDFTEGDAPHKRLFATDSVDCVDLILLRATIQNRITLAALGSFDRTVSVISSLADRAGIKVRLRFLLRRGAQAWRTRQ